MSGSGPVEGVYLSATLDLERLFRRAFAVHGDRVRLRSPAQIEDPSSVRFALCWHPPAHAFAPYPNLMLVSSIAAGVDSLVSCPSLPADAIVTRVHDPDQADLMAGFAAWHVVWHHRRMGHYLACQAEGRWAEHAIAELARPRDVPVGILGYGVMGAAVARAVRAMGFPVVVARSGDGPASAPDGIAFEWGDGAIRRTAARSRILVNVLPLTPRTRGVLDRHLFAAMPSGAALIQIGRGDHLIDEDLTWALDEGHLAGASVDVFRHEPLPTDHPWWRDPRIVVTPHQASDSDVGLMAAQVADAAAAVAVGQMPPHAIDRSRGY